jgi:hypothetical protein
MIRRLENLIPDPAIYKFETGTGFEFRPVIQPDGQAVVFDFNYVYTTNVARADGGGRKAFGPGYKALHRHGVQLSNVEFCEVSRCRLRTCSPPSLEG